MVAAGAWVGCGGGVPSKLPTAELFSAEVSPETEVDTGARDTDDSGDDSGGDTADTARDTGTDADRDGDGFEAPLDCDDGDPTVYPGAEEVCGNGMDDDCDGQSCRWDGSTGGLLLGRRSDSAGASVAVGDISGDGQLDVVVGAPDAAGGARAGTVWVWPAGGVDTDTPLESAGFVLGPDAVAEGAGRTVRVPGDLSGDGVADLVVGTHHVPDEAAGRVSVLLGPVDASARLVEPDAWLPIPEALELNLFVAAGPARSGAVSLLLGAPFEDGGVVRLMDGPWSGARDLSEATVTWTAATGEAGRSMAVPGDLDGDGVDDVLIGVPGEGMVAVLTATAATGAVEDADRFLQPDPPRATFGTEVVGAGDVDGDGLVDVLVSVATGAEDAGTVGLMCGPTGLECARFDGRVAGEQLGHGLAGVGDTEGDGWADVALAGHGVSAVGVWFGPVSGTHTLDSADAVTAFEGQAGFSVAASGGVLALGAPTAGTVEPPSGGVGLVVFPEL